MITCQNTYYILKVSAKGFACQNTTHSGRQQHNMTSQSQHVRTKIRTPALDVSCTPS